MKLLINTASTFKGGGVQVAEFYKGKIAGLLYDMLVDFVFDICIVFLVFRWGLA